MSLLSPSAIFVEYGIYRKIYGMTDRIENIGSMIRNERIRKGLTQEELGERVGVGKAQISKVESGKGLTIKTVTKVLDALGMSVSVVLQNAQAVDKNVIAYLEILCSHCRASECDSIIFSNLS